MDSMTRQHPLGKPDRPASLNRLDMPAARMSSAVLISAPRNHSLAIALAIACEGTEDEVAIVRAGDTVGLRSALSRATAEFDGLRTIVIQDVDTLERAQQLTLRTAMEHPARRRAVACRILATTSVPLFDLVTEGRFDARLFYRLNAVHIVRDGAGARDRADDITKN